jgi:hypothetical protein
VSKRKSTGPYIDSHQSAVQHAEGLDISDYQRTRSDVGLDLCLLYATYVTVKNLFWIRLSRVPTKTADVDNHKLRDHVRVILYLLTVTSANVTSSEFPVSVFRNIYACHYTVFMYLHQTAIQARAELIV